MSDSLDAMRPEPGTYDLGILGGAKRVLKFDLNAFAEMERMYGSMEKANEALTAGSMQEIRRILWLGLIHDQAILDEITGEPIKYKLTIYEVGGWLNPTNMKPVMARLTAAINGSLPDEPENDPKPVLNVVATEAAGGDPNK